ncbi:MAG: addiction module toxin, HicA family [Actinomycetia bacterium]|nr:addiction module toxin, HicA family [Actinomycetes bacterium]
MVKRIDLDKEAKALGFKITKKKRGRHDAYTKDSHNVPVPKKREIRENLAKEIRKQMMGKRPRD